MKITQNIKAKSHFNIIKLDKDGNEIYHSNDNYNTITDYGYQQMYGFNGNSNRWPYGTNYYHMRYLYLGSDNSEIVPQDTGLGNVIHIRDGHSGTKPSAPTRTFVEIDGNSYVRIVQYFAWGLGALDNVTFSELGIFRESSGNNTLICGQNIKDSNGNPTSVTVLGDEQLILKYTSYWPAIRSGDVLGIGTVVINGTTHNAVYSAYADMVTGYSEYTNTFPSNNADYIWVSNSPISNPTRQNSGSGNCTVVRNNYSTHIERIISLRCNMLPYTSPIASWGVPSGSSSSGSSSPRSKLVFDPPLPKSPDNVVEFRFTWILRWREE